MMQCGFSVVIPAHNEEAWIGRCLGAIGNTMRRKIVVWLESENPHDYYAKNHPESKQR